MNTTIDIIFKIIAIIGIGWGASTTFTAKTDSVRFDPSPIIERIAKTETTNAVQDSEIDTITKDISEIKTDVKSILKAVRPDDYKPADINNFTPLVKGVKHDGSPDNE